MRFYSQSELDDMSQRISELVEMDFTKLSERERLGRNVELIFLKGMYAIHSGNKLNDYQIN